MNVYKFKLHIYIQKRLQDEKKLIRIKCYLQQRYIVTECV